MKLTAEELAHISPGIYRTKFSHINGVPGLRSVEPESRDISRLLIDLISQDLTRGGLSAVVTGEEKIDESGHWPQRTYFPSIEAFLDAWKRGYDTGVSQFGTNQVYNKLGFELFYVNWKPGSEFFSFGDHTGIEYMGNRADLNPIIILGDNNGMNDQSGYLNLGVNDFRTLKVLVYRELDNGRVVENVGKIDLTPATPKHLRDDIHYYVWSGPDRFPFGSPNSLKSSHNMWTAVGISPLEIYSALEKLGFVFPPIQGPKS